MWHEWEDVNAFKILVGKSEGMRPLGSLRHRWDDNIKTNFKKQDARVRTGFK
jgi:hypothetical protein